MAIKWLDAKRLQGTNAERLAMTTSGDGLGSSAEGTNTDITLDTANYKLGSASYSFNGTSSEVNIGVSTQFPEGANDRSVSLWFRTDDTSFSPNEMFAWGNLGSTYNYVVGLYTNAGIFVSGYSSPQWTTTTPYINYNDDDWHLIVVTLGSGTHKIYIDGSEIDSRSAVFDTGGGGTVKNAVIGNFGAGGSEDWTGELDDMAIWNRVITSGEVTSLWNSGDGALANSISTTGLLAYYNFESVTDDKLVNQVPVYPSLPNGTIFNETDTYKYFMFDGTDTWNQMVSS